ncbi:serine hydrolase [Micromonospora sp. NPDC000663]|uniref:serine hydrolase n=1 Tax=Micromonospora sp. NPDC000663 TaxID=3364218 RepID=UPI0036C86476
MANPLPASPLSHLVLLALTALDGVFPMIPSEVAALAAGVLAHTGTLSLPLVICATALGVFAGDHLAYGLSRSVLGPRLIGRSRHVSRAVAAASRRLDRHAGPLIVTSRFLPGGRIAMNAASGMTRLPLAQFSPASAVAALAWSTYIAGLGYLGGAVFVEHPLLGLAAGLGVSFAVGAGFELVRRRAGRRRVEQRRHPALAAAVAALAVMAVPAAAVAKPADADRRELQEQLNAIVSAGAVGALARLRDERGEWQGVSGVAERGTTRRVSAESRFRAGSITKTFTATVTLQLAGEGRLRVDDAVESWLPGVVPNGQRITVRHLLNHTGGLYDYLRTLPLPPSPWFLDNRWRTWSSAELSARALANPPTFEPPGSSFAYSNTGYLLLGQIIEKASGRSYRQEVERRIIQPLRLRGTSMPGSSPSIPGPHPHGYVPIDRDGVRDLVDYTLMNPTVMGAGGEIISTTADLNRFFAALLGGELLPSNLLREMKTPGLEGGRYGLGLAWWHDTTCGIRLYGHDGDALAYQSWSFSTEDGHRQVTVALTPNFAGDPEDAVGALLDRAFCD